MATAAATAETATVATVATAARVVTAVRVATAVRASTAETLLPLSAVLWSAPPEPLLLKKEEQTNVDA